MAGLSLLRHCRRLHVSANSTSAWPGSGLSFKCTQCGKCCTGGPERAVYVSEQEANALANSLGLEGDQFADQYLQAGSVGSRFSLRKNTTNTACVFLTDGKCSVYQHRPIQCRTYPFWPEPLTSRYDWEAEALRCEGIQIKSSLPISQHRQYCNVAAQVAKSENKENKATEAAQQDPEEAFAGRAEAAASPEASISSTDDAASALADEATTPVETIKRQLVLEEISRSGEMGGTTYSDMEELLTSVSPQLVDEFAENFFTNRGRELLHDSKRWRVLNTWLGDPREHFRSLVLKSCPGYAQTEVQLRQQLDGSMSVRHDKLHQPAHKAMCLAFALQAMSQKQMHSAAASSLHKPVSVHDAPSLQPSTELAVAVIGAGACALPMAIRHHFPKATIDAVDIDAEALDLGQCFFDAKEDSHLMMHNEDGVRFLTRHGVSSQFDIIMLDVAAPDPAGDPGMLNSIPSQFLSQNFIEEGLCRRLKPGGVAAINILGGLSAVTDAVTKLHPHFQHLHALCTPEFSIVFGKANLGGGKDTQRRENTALWRVTAAAATLKPLSVLCDEVLSEQLELWAVNDELHDMLKAHHGYGWLFTQDLVMLDPQVA